MSGAGFSDKAARTPCRLDDQYAWGSTTKTQTSVMIMKLWELGKLKLDDPVVPHANAFLRRISNGTQDLVALYGKGIHNVTIRSLLQFSGRRFRRKAPATPKE